MFYKCIVADIKMVMLVIDQTIQLYNRILVMNLKIEIIWEQVTNLIIE